MMNQTFESYNLRGRINILWWLELQTLISSHIYNVMDIYRHMHLLCVYLIISFIYMYILNYMYIYFFI